MPMQASRRCLKRGCVWIVRLALRRYLFTFVRERARQRWAEEHVGIPRIIAAGIRVGDGALVAILELVNYELKKKEKKERPKKEEVAEETKS